MTFTKEETLAALDKAIEEYGEDHKYEHPSWTDEDTSASCMYVHNRGTDEEVPEILEGTVPYSGANLTFVEDEARARLKAANEYWSQWDEDTLRLLDCAQMQQDGGNTWGVAVSEAKRKHA